MMFSRIELRLRETWLPQEGRSEGREGGIVGSKVASEVNNFFRANIWRPLLCALAAMPSNYSPRPPVIIPITSRTEESVTQRAGQGEGKATEQRINISFTHHASPSRPWIKYRGRRGVRARENREGRREGTRSTENDSSLLISCGFKEGEEGELRR